MSEPNPRSRKQIKLSGTGLQNVAALGIRDFGVTVGDWKVECSRLEASFVSPRITAALLNDPTISEFEVEIDARLGSADPVSWLSSLLRTGSFEVTRSNFESVRWIAKELGNRELYEALWEFINDGEELNCSNAGERLSLAEFLEVSPLREIEYLASHFHEAEGNVLKSLKHEYLRSILESEKLRIETEDSLMDFVVELGRDYFDLLGLIRSEYLSESGIDRLLTTISIVDVDGKLWSSLCRRLRLCVPVSSTGNSRFCRPSFVLDSNRPFDGIISHLTRECGGNVHTRGIVSITASSNYYNQCYQVADYDWCNYWYSNDETNSWIQFDFKHRQVSLTNYTIRSDKAGCYHPLQWSLAGSNDERSWTTLDQRNTQDLNGDNRVKSFDCKSLQSSTSSFRFLRLTQTGANSSDANYLLLANLEFFGVVTA
jgi:hypothetical protein